MTVEPCGIYAALFARDRFKSYHWTLFLATSSTQGIQYRVFKVPSPIDSSNATEIPLSTSASMPPQPTTTSSISSNGWTYESSTFVPSRSVELLVLYKLGALDPDWEPDILEQYIKPDQIPLGIDTSVVASEKLSATSQTPDGYTSQQWFREAIQRIHDVGVFMEGEEIDVDTIETTLWFAARSAESLARVHVTTGSTSRLS